MTDSVLGDTCPNDGRDWEVQCARCGGECVRHQCEDCDDGHTDFGALHEMDPLNYDEMDTEPCDVCHGEGGWWVCANTAEWCEAHPMENRLSVRPGTLEFYVRSTRAAG